MTGQEVWEQSELRRILGRPTSMEAQRINRV